MRFLGTYPYKVTTTTYGKKEISFPQFAGMKTWVDGDADDRAVYKAAHDYLLAIFSARMDERLQVPGGKALDSGVGDAYVFVSWLTLAKIILYEQFRVTEMKPSQFARKIGVTQASFTRLLNVRHESSERLIFSAFDALGIETDWDLNARPIRHSYPS